MRAVTDAAVARLQEIGAVRAYREGEVPPDPVTAYFIVSTGVGIGRNPRTGGATSTRSRRLVVRFYGQDYDEVGWAAEKALEAFEGFRLTPDANPCRLFLDTTLDLDDPLIGGIHTYNY